MVVKGAKQYKAGLDDRLYKVKSKISATFENLDSIKTELDHFQFTLNYLQKSWDKECNKTKTPPNARKPWKGNRVYPYSASINNSGAHKNVTNNRRR